MAWDDAPATAIAGTVLAASFWNTEVRDRMLAIGSGTVALDQVLFADNEGASVSDAGTARLRLHGTRAALEASVDGGDYNELATNGRAIAMALIFGA